MKMDFLSPSPLPYPGQVVPCSGGSTINPVPAGGYQAPSRDGLFNSLFAPDDLPYPLPNGGQVTTTPPSGVTCTCACSCSPQQQAPTGTVTTAPATPVATATPTAQASGTASNQPNTSTATPANSPAAAPSQIVINVGVPGNAAAAPQASTSASAGSPSQGGSDSSSTFANAVTTTPAAATQPDDSTAAQAAALTCKLSDAFVNAYAYNPRLRARAPRAHEQLLEDMLDESLTNRLLTSNSAPLAFVVPDGGFDTVEFFTKAPELNPGRGQLGDDELAVNIGAPKLANCATNGSLHSGDQVSVTFPWRYAPNVELAPDHLRVAVSARFTRSSA